MSSSAPSVVVGPDGPDGPDRTDTGFVYNVPRAYVDQNLLNTGTSSAFDTRSDAAQLQTTQELLERIRQNNADLMREMSGFDSDPDSLESQSRDVVELVK